MHTGAAHSEQNRVSVIWADCVDRLESEFAERDLVSWIRPLQVLETPGQLTLYAPSPVVQQRVQQDFVPAITRICRQLSTDEKLNVVLVTGSPPAPAPAVSADTESHENKSRQAGGSYANAPREANKLNAQFTFETFIQGKSNEQARAAAQQVAEAPGARYNPLLIYGESGLGKTHLMHAVGNAIANRPGRARVLYVGAEKFVRDLVTAIRFNTTEEFKSRYRSVDALLIDDIHFFAGKSSSQEEYFHTFNELLDGRQQMVMTCDRYPAELDGLDARLKSRFTWGLTVPIEPPELETRVAILQTKAESKNIILSDKVAFLVAQRVRSNVRELEGALNRLAASSMLTGRPIDEDFAREMLGDIFSSYERMITMENIKRQVATYYKIRVADLASARRNRMLARPRQVAMSLCKELTQHSLPEIGESFEKDHTTVLHACKRIKSLRETEPRIREDWENLLRLLGG